MGAGSKKPPPLPAPTETDTTTPTELTATDLSKPGDEKSTYSIPEDGTPVTIRTRGHKANRSQTSLLIEYFEGSKSSNGASGSSRKPSVRVRLTPSKQRKGDHLQVTETKGSRKASLTKRIPLDEVISSQEIDLAHGEDLSSLGSYASATEESNVSKNPIDIEIDRPHRKRRPASPLIPSAEAYQPGNPSEISAIPTDSFLDGTAQAVDLRRATSPAHTAGLVSGAGAGLSAAAAVEDANSRRRSGGKSKSKHAESSQERSERKRRPKSRSTSVSEQQDVEGKSARRRSSKSHQESQVSGAESSLLSSHPTNSHRSYETHSTRSDASRSSINNPKLLAMVEDSIRRLILPELSALKREQSKRETRRDSQTSTNTSLSREEAHADRRASAGKHLLGSPKHKDRRNREGRHQYDDEDSLRSHSIDSLDAEYRHHSRGGTTPRHSSNDLLKAAAAGAAGAAMAKGLTSIVGDDGPPEDRRQRERRRRRAESSRSRSLGRDRYTSEYDEEHIPAPPMPLMSDINPSELTRTSILSAESERPHSAAEEYGATGRDMRGGAASASSTPALHDDHYYMLGTKHANVSHGDLTALPRGQKENSVREYETDEFGNKTPISYYHHGYEGEDSRDFSDPGDYPEDEDYDTSYYGTQDVPPPLKYVPYQFGARGLSPIPSVSGYTEGDVESQHPRNSRNFHSPSGELHQRRSVQSVNSIPSNMRSREFDALSVEERSKAGSSPVKSQDGFLEDHISSGQAVKGVGASPNLVHPPTGVESAVASLIDGSMLDQSVLTSGSTHEDATPRAHPSSDDGHYRGNSIRGLSPDKSSVHSRHVDDADAERLSRDIAESDSQDHPQDFSEYELDEHGRKVPRRTHRQSPTASEAAITAGAVGAAAAALKAAQERKQMAAEGEWQPAGVFRNKSFKERAMEGGDPRSTPAHSVDRFDYDEAPEFGATGTPDVDRPMPEADYMDIDQETNPSVIYDGAADRASPTQTKNKGKQAAYSSGHATPTDERGLGATEAAGIAALGAAAGLAAAHDQRSHQEADEWQRTSDDRKRDTLVTNPYEDASPIVNPILNDTMAGNRAFNADYDTPYAAGSPGFAKYDEGYMSNGPLGSPDIEPRSKAMGLGSAGIAGMDDPFYVSASQPRQLSGMSQGMKSPFFDASTGAGIDRIENKDIVALMQHLMVRDAQRSARDTEIVALLMNAALEMRTSFQEMKDLIQDTGDDVIFANVENTEKLQKAINGPRPFPSAGARSIQSGSQPGTLDESGQKKKNLWKRALQGLSSKGTTDLTRIEEMLMQLLGEVDVLKTQTAGGGPSGIQDRSIDDVPQHQQSQQQYRMEEAYDEDTGYDPEGYSGTSHNSPSSRHVAAQQAKDNTARRASANRVSTVQEHEEEGLYSHPSPSNERSHHDLLSPEQANQQDRAGSVPLDASPAYNSSQSAQQPLSAGNTPRTEKGKKHKSSSSSGWLPKISRWSETTASSVGKAFKSKKEPKYDDYLPPSRSGSSLASYEAAYMHDPYDDKLHSGFSDPNLQRTGQVPPITSAPQQAADGAAASGAMPEDPKYKAHRDSLNLQHPQPRPGQTERFRTALEYSAQDYYDPATPRSADWAGSATSLHQNPQSSQRHSNATVTREDGYWSSPTQQPSGPPRPPKEPLEEYGTQLQTPPRVGRVSDLAKGSPSGTHDSTYGTMSGTQLSRYAGSPKPENKNLSGAYGVPARKPTGPRAMTPRSAEEAAAREERRRKRDTFGSTVTHDTETF